MRHQRQKHYIRLETKVLLETPGSESLPLRGPQGPPCPTHLVRVEAPVPAPRGLTQGNVRARLAFPEAGAGLKVFPGPPTQRRDLGLPQDAQGVREPFSRGLGVPPGVAG